MIRGENNHTASSTTIATVLFVIVMYILLILLVDPYLRLSADSTLYISIAEKYLSGDLDNAINGYWNPLLSWLLIPFLYSGYSDVFAINAIYIIFGVLTILGVWRLSYRFRLEERVRTGVLLSLFPIVLYYSYIQPFDLILLCLLIYYLCIVFNDSYPERVWNGILSGVTGALAYLTKSYAFPFFISHFLFMNIFHFLKIGAKRRGVIKNAIAGFTVFFLISGVWIAMLSNKYGYFTFSNMGRTNLAIMGPDMPQSGGLEFGQPMFYRGFIEPPNKTAISAWEDPSYIEVKTWNPLGSLSNLKHFIKLILKNLVEGLRIFGSFSVFSVTIAIAHVLLLIIRPFRLSNIISRSDLLYPLFTILLYTGGYALFHFEARYLWVVNILLLLMGGHLVSLLFHNNLFEDGARKFILLLVFVVSFIFIPSYRVISISGGNLDSRMHTLSMELRELGVSGNIASNREYTPVHDAWHKTFRLAYWLDSRYYGQAKRGISDVELMEELKRYNIDYYLVWGDIYENRGLLSGYREITGGKITGLKVFVTKDESSHN